MRIALVLAGSLLLGSIAAQEPADPQPQAPVKVSAADRMQELQDLQQKAVTVWRAEIKASQEAAKDGTDGKSVKAMAMRPDFGPIAAKAAEFAKDFAGTDDAVQFLMMSVQSSTDKSVQKSSIQTMLKSHLDSPELAQMGRMLQHLHEMIDPEFAASTKQRMLESKNTDVRGWAVFAQHKSAIEMADRDGEDYAAAKKALLAAAGHVDDMRLAKQMQDAIDLREKYGVGCDSPDIVGIDLDGIEFKLSDYKGKVIFLDFWGDW